MMDKFAHSRARAKKKKERKTRAKNVSLVHEMGFGALGEKNVAAEGEEEKERGRKKRATCFPRCCGILNVQAGPRVYASSEGLHTELTTLKLTKQGGGRGVAFRTPGFEPTTSPPRDQCLDHSAKQQVSTDNKQTARRWQGDEPKPFLTRALDEGRKVRPRCCSAFETSLPHSRPETQAGKASEP